MLVLDAELNSLQNGTIFNSGHCGKVGLEAQIPDFCPDFFSKRCRDTFHDFC